MVVVEVGCGGYWRWLLEMAWVPKLVGSDGGQKVFASDGGQSWPMNGGGSHINIVEVKYNIEGIVVILRII